MTSAVDQLPSSASPAASSSTAAGENSAAKPRANAVASEVPVIATGARPSENGGKRELFTEETSTALVFENGAVLRLAAAVAPGQLLFLTHKESKREVVTQVTRKRDFRPGICYVEVEFSEPSPGFWGIKSPEMPAIVPTQSPQKEAAQPAQAAEDLIGDEPSVPTTAPSAQDITALKNEVEALREQLKLLQTQTVARNLSAPAGIPALSGAMVGELPRGAAGASPQGGVLADAVTQLLPNTDGEALQSLPAEVSGALANAGAAASSAPDSPPNDRAKRAFCAQDLLPERPLNFESAEPPEKPASQPPRKIAAKNPPATLRKDILFAAFVIVTAAAAWYQNLLPWLPQPKIFSRSAAPNIAARPAPRVPAKTNAQADTAKSPAGNAVPAAAPSADLHDRPKAASSGKAKPSAPAVTETTEEGKSARDEAADSAPVNEKPELVTSARKRNSAPVLSKAAIVSEVPASNGGGIVPPKLIKSVRAVASTSALEDFATGDANNVTLDALVDVTGHVKSMKVLSGAALLRSPAMAALKQYVYEPATQGGKPIPAHVTVKIKFLFER